MINYWRLSNGTRLVVEEIPHLHSAAIGIFISVGSRHEPEGLKGASHFIEHMLFKGTERLSTREIAEKFEGIGGQLNAYTAKEYTCLYARVLDEDLFMATEILLDMLFNSQFSEREFQTEKSVIIEEINMNEDTPDDLIHELFSRNLWLNHRMGSPILGTLHSVSNFKRSEIFDFYKKTYVPSNIVIAVAGNVQGEKLKDIIEKLMENQPKHSFIPEKTKPVVNQGFIKLLEKDTEQIQICVGVEGLSYHDERRFAQNIMNSILGGGMSSRLFQKLREELGLAYSIYSYPSNYSDTGSYLVYIGTGPARIAECLDAMFDEVKSFIFHGITEQELERTQKLIKSSMYLGLESVMSRMSRLGKSVMMYDRIVNPEETIAQVFAVTQSDIMELALDILGKQSVSIAAIGPGTVLADLEKEYKKYGLIKKTVSRPGI